MRGDQKIRLFEIEVLYALRVYGAVIGFHIHPGPERLGTDALQNPFRGEGPGAVYPPAFAGL